MSMIKYAGMAVAMFCVPISAQAEDDAMYYDAAGRYADVIRLTESQLAHGEQATASQLGWECIAYEEVKQYSKALDCADKLDAKIAQGDVYMSGHYFGEWKSDARPVPGMVRAEVYTDLAQYGEALKAGDQALLPATDGKVDGMTNWSPERFQVTVLGVLVLAAKLNGEDERARNYLSRLEKVSIPFMGGTLIEAHKSNSLARAYMALGQYDKALGQLGTRHGLNFAAGLVNVFSPFASHGDSLTTISELPRLLMRGKALAETGKESEAKKEFDQILAHPRINDLGELHWLTLFERGRIAEKEKDATRAAELYAKAVDVIEQQRASINTEASKIGFVGDKQAVYGRLIAVLAGQGRAAEAFDYVERSKSRALVDMLASKKDFAAPDTEQARTVLAQLDAAEQGTRMLDEAAKPDAQSAVTRNLDVARQAVQTTVPELSSLVTVTSVAADDIKPLVGDEALVEYYYQGSEMYAFVLDREHLQVVPLNADRLSAEIQALRAELEDPASSRWQEDSHALYSRLWKPLESLLTGKSVIVVAHGALHYLPFSVLVDDEGKFLIDRYSMRFLPSASVMKYLRPPMQKGGEQQLVLGNPDLGNPALDLQFAGEEARTIAALSPGARLLLRKDASEGNFKKIGGVFQRIHFATHGKFQADKPLESGLYLAGDANDDGVLTVSELYSMNLDADLVTLSACETGLGKIANGDDVVGLTRGFLYAGSRSVVASLWSVDDKATELLMQTFYGNLASMNKEEALRQAQIKTRASFPHPFYWAAFQLTGRAD